MMRLSLPLCVVVAGLCTVSSSAIAADCTCRYDGLDYQLGEMACMRRGDQMRLARCDMVLNNTSWTITDERCPFSHAPELRPYSVATQTPLPQTPDFVSFKPAESR